MSIEEFLSNPEEDKVYVIPDNEELVELYRKQSDLPTDSNSEEADDSIEPKIISVNEASKKNDCNETDYDGSIFK